MTKKRKYYFALLLIAVFCLLISATKTYKASNAQASYKLTSYVYARAEKEGAFLYKTPSVVQEDNIYFEIPKSYFVLLISNFTTDFYKAQYRDMVGYVLKNTVSPVKEKPQTPYLTNITFRVFSSDGLEMLSSPFPSINKVIVQNVELYKSIDYYGSCYGDEYVEGRGNIWYYCKDEKSGYLYKGLCDNLSPIPLNTELTTTIENPFETGDNDYLYALVDLSIEMKIILVIVVCAPSILIVYMLFKPFRIKKKMTKNRRKSIKNKRKTILEEMNEEKY